MSLSNFASLVVFWKHWMDNYKTYSIIYRFKDFKRCALRQIAFFKNLICRKRPGIERICSPRRKIACHMLRLYFGTPEKVETICGNAIKNGSNSLVSIAQHKRTNRCVRTFLSLQFIGCEVKI